jgi:hypothetical protein
MSDNDQANVATCSYPGMQKQPIKHAQKVQSRRPLAS